MPKNEAAPLVTTPPQEISQNEVLDNRQAAQSQRRNNLRTGLRAAEHCLIRATAAYRRGEEAEFRLIDAGCDPRSVAREPERRGKRGRG